MITINYRNTTFNFVEAGAKDLISEVILDDHYQVFSSGITFLPGDYVLDIGANEGLFSIMIAKIFPFVHVISYEPVKRTFGYFMNNLEINNLLNANIEPYLCGVSDFRGRTDLRCHHIFSTVSSSQVTQHMTCSDNVEMTLLDDAIMKCGDHLKLLKMDIEGGEYDALYPSTLLSHAEFMVAEFHANTHLRSRGAEFDVDKLAAWVSERTKLLYCERKEVWE